MASLNHAVTSRPPPLFLCQTSPHLLLLLLPLTNRLYTRATPTYRLTRTVERKLGVVLKSIVFFSFYVHIPLLLRILSLHILRLKNETNIPFDLRKKHLLPFALTAKLRMWMPPFLSRN